MAAPNSQFSAGSGSRNPNIVPKKEAQERDAFSIERERLAAECKAIKEQYLKEAAIRSKKYEADMRQELLETYFSHKDIFGDKIFEETGVDGVKAGRCAGTESYADPVAYLKKKEASAKSAANTSTARKKSSNISSLKCATPVNWRSCPICTGALYQLGQATNGFTDILKKNLS